ncbi:MAG: hypothetical protein WBW94_06130 [Anaerolineales bacterium]
MFTTIVLKYGTTFANLFVIWIAVSHFVIGILLLAFHKNKPVKMILLTARGIAFIVAIITTFVMIGEHVRLYAFVGWILILLVLIFAVIRAIFAEWRGTTPSRNKNEYQSKRGNRRYSNRRSVQPVEHNQAPTNAPGN